MNNLRRNVMTVVPFDLREALFLLIIAYAAGAAANQRERRIPVCTCRMQSGMHATRAAARSAYANPDEADYSMPLHPARHRRLSAS